MRCRLVLALALCLLPLTPAAFSQEGGGQAAAENSGEGGLEIWRWANFVLLVGGLGYLIGKYGGAFFAKRSLQIRKDMWDAEEARKAAERRAVEVDARLANLEAEIAALRAESQKEAAAEQQRIRQQTAADMARIRAQAEQEIAAAGKAARMDLKRYSAELAIGLAEQKLRARVHPSTQESLVRGFVRDLESVSSKAQAT
jgi:F-type H+-transporting ATPase subunit b